MYVSDTLSRAALPLTMVDKSKPDYIIYQLQEEEHFRKELEEINQEDTLFVTDHRLNQIRVETGKDITLQTLMSIVTAGWPEDKANVPLCAREYWPYRDEISTQNGLVYRGTRIIIPTTLRPEMTERAHAAHMGIQYTNNTARKIMYWPRMSAELTEAVQRCNTCQEAQPANPKETMMTYPIAKYPWQCVASDCFEIKGNQYLVIVDMYSDYIEVAELSDLSSDSVIAAMKPILANQGSPAVLLTDNASCYTSSTFNAFTTSWDIQHITSSPHHHKANGKAESAVKIMKAIIKKTKQNNGDIWKAILEWRNAITPGMTSSPAQRLMSRRTRSLLPCKDTEYYPEVQQAVPEQVIRKRKVSAKYYDRTAKQLPALHIGQPVRAKTHPHNTHSSWHSAIVTEKVAPRSYIVDVNGRQYRRNRVHLRDSLEPPREVEPVLSDDDLTSEHNSPTREQEPGSRLDTNTAVPQIVTGHSSANETPPIRKSTRCHPNSKTIYVVKMPRGANGSLPRKGFKRTMNGLIHLRCRRIAAS